MRDNLKNDVFFYSLPQVKGDPVLSKLRACTSCETGHATTVTSWFIKTLSLVFTFHFFTLTGTSCETGHATTMV